MIDGWTPKKVVSIDEHSSWKGDATGYCCGDEIPPPFSNYKTLDTRFLQAMEEIGLYGNAKYGSKSFDAQRQTGTLKRFDRTETRSIQMHTSIHFAEYADNVPHDHFQTLRHQLAAAAFNAMMEYVYAVEADGRAI